MTCRNWFSRTCVEWKESELSKNPSLFDGRSVGKPNHVLIVG